MEFCEPNCSIIWKYTAAIRLCIRSFTKLLTQCAHKIYFFIYSHDRMKQSGLGAQQLSSECMHITLISTILITSNKSFSAPRACQDTFGIFMAVLGLGGIDYHALSVGVGRVLVTIIAIYKSSSHLFSKLHQCLLREKYSLRK